ncbi:ATP-binding protein [Streptomyces sp. NPDC006422]|uniref:ATP-binding protein n=1 Tax=unclassified Streptomyces TaxID=2593676 RepID=UPI00339E8AC7
MTTTTARPDATGKPGYSETLPCEPESACRARTLVSTALHAWGLAGLAEDGKLIVSELVSNVIAHTRCHVTRVAVARIDDDSVQITVADVSQRIPKVAAPSEHSRSGRGLLIVDALSDRWGYDLRRSSKVVWVQLRIGSGEVER